LKREEPAGIRPNGSPQTPGLAIVGLARPPRDALMTPRGLVRLARFLGLGIVGCKRTVTAGEFLVGDPQNRIVSLFGFGFVFLSPFEIERRVLFRIHAYVV
jgi:hypothetical protein